MKKIIFGIPLLLLLVSCGSSKKKAEREEHRSISVQAGTLNTIEDDIRNDGLILDDRNESSKKKARDIIDTALSFKGTRYKFGGITKSGMDCSGLVFTSFKNNDISLPRSSYEIAERGIEISIEEVQKGDLLFFNTNSRGKRINHVGLVIEAGKEILFIHATSSRGVLVSSLTEGYWNYAFVKAKRIL